MSNDSVMGSAAVAGSKEVSVSYDEWNAFLHDIAAYLKATTRQISFGSYTAHQEAAEQRFRASLNVLDAKFEAIRATQSGQEWPMPLSSPLVLHKQPHDARAGDGLDYSLMRDDRVLALLAAPGVATPEFKKFLASLPQAVNAFEPMREALGHMINMLEASLFGQKNIGGVRWEVGKTDVAITPDGSYKLSDARAALKLAGDAT